MSVFSYEFTVDSDTEGELVFDFDGATNFRNDAVGASLHRIDDDSAVLGTLFALSTTGLDGAGTGTQTVSLVAGDATS